MHLSVDSFRDICDKDYAPGVQLPKEGVIHAKAEFAPECMRKMRRLNGRYVLVVHRSDRPFTDDLVMEMSNAVRRVFARNCFVQHPRVETIPIGLAEHDLPHGQWAAMQKALAAPRGDKLLYVGFALNTNPSRVDAINAVGGFGTLDVYERWDDKPRDYADFLCRMRDHRFVLSPPGNGVDCHRTYEALYLGCTPICLDSIPMRPLAKLFPIMLVNDWREVTRERLEAWREPEWDRGALTAEWWRKRFVEALAT